MNRLRLRRLIDYTVAVLCGAGVQCNICDWRGLRMQSDCWHPHTICPHCRSQVRHRLLMELFRSYQGFRLADLVDGKRVLHFAPEQVLSKHLETRAARYVTADISRSEVSLQLDLCAMDSVPDGSFDTLIACDVLEHTPDDALAMSEIHRVLDPGGVAVITVPQGDDFQTTYEDPAVNTPEARQREYGQFDHRRIYGADFADRLAQYGFAVSALDASYSQRSRSTRRWPKRGPGRPTPNPRRLPELRSSAQR